MFATSTSYTPPGREPVIPDGLPPRIVRLNSFNLREIEEAEAAKSREQQKNEVWLLQLFLSVRALMAIIHRVNPLGWIQL